MAGGVYKCKCMHFVRLRSRSAERPHRSSSERGDSSHTAKKVKNTIFSYEAIADPFARLDGAVEGSSSSLPAGGARCCVLEMYVSQTDSDIQDRHRNLSVPV